MTPCNFQVGIGIQFFQFGYQHFSKIFFLNFYLLRFIYFILYKYVFSLHACCAPLACLNQNTAMIPLELVTDSHEPQYRYRRIKLRFSTRANVLLTLSHLFCSCPGDSKTKNIMVQLPKIFVRGRNRFLALTIGMNLFNY